MPAGLAGFLDQLEPACYDNRYKDSGIEIYRWVKERTWEEKQQLFSYFTARMLRSDDHLFDEKNKSDILQQVGQDLAVDLPQQWRPLQDKFWKRLSKDHMLAIAEEVLGADWKATHQDFKKAELAQVLADIFVGEATENLTATQRHAAKTWIPRYMGYALEEEAELQCQMEAASKADKTAEILELPTAFAL